MSRNGSGTYSIPNTLVSGTTITAVGHNQNYSDIASEITNSVAVDGQSTMTAPLKASSGTAAAPSHTFGADTDTGGYRSGANEYSVAAGGVQITKVSSAGLDIKSGSLLINGTAVATATLAQGAALSVLGVTGNATADRADIAASVDGYVLRRSGTSVGFGTVVTGGLADGAVTLAKQADLDSGAFIVRYTASTGVPQAGSFGASLTLNTSTGVLSVTSPASETFISSQTASASSAIAFTSGIDSTYREYVFKLDNVLPATDGAALTMQVSTDGGSNWKTTSYVATLIGYNSAAATNNATSTSAILISSNAGSGANPSNSAGYGVSCSVAIIGPSNSASRKVITVAPYSYKATGTNPFLVAASSGYWDGGNDVINAVRFIESSGNIASGTFSMYGIKGS